ncbi:MAG TPA: Asp-tRNA(Asn)/Glu-tRNA(Gln) amidotransferase subunit GatC [Planctomycetota bacterium]|nr:Asp-tRNA(Asn)/Glu-tRNA(Gln) amidotransferase subunit GatC [Planctomycetota bacterium]
MSIPVTDALVRHIADLSRLAISDHEAREMKEHFEKILAYISGFQALETEDVDPTFFSVEASNVYREDTTRPSLPRAQVLANAPQSDGVHFVVPLVVGDADSGIVEPGSRGSDSPTLPGAGGGHA